MRQNTRNNLMVGTVAAVMFWGGAFGKATSYWPLPLELQGKKVLVDVIAKRNYGHGRGELIRYRGGLMVGSVPGSAAFDVLKVLGVFGGIHGGRPARTEILLPNGVASNPGGVPEAETHTFWRL